MFIFRKSRRLFMFIRQHIYLTISLLLTIILLLIFYEVIIYHIYIQIVDLRPYENAITFWSTDFHIR